MTAGKSSIFQGYDKITIVSLFLWDFHWLDPIAFDQSSSVEYSIFTNDRIFAPYMTVIQRSPNPPIHAKPAANPVAAAMPLFSTNGTTPAMSPAIKKLRSPLFAAMLSALRECMMSTPYAALGDKTRSAPRPFKKRNAAFRTSHGAVEPPNWETSPEPRIESGTTQPAPIRVPCSRASGYQSFWVPFL